MTEMEGFDPGEDGTEGAVHSMIRTLLVVPFSLTLLLSMTFPAASAFGADPTEAVPLLAGVGRSDITPEPGMPMAGYGDRKNRPSAGVHDRLACRALYLEKGDLSVCLVSCDILVITPELRDAVMARLADLRIDVVLLAATHTHAGPGGFKKGWAVEKMLMGSHTESMLPFLADRVAEAVHSAAESTAPATVGFATGEAARLIHNRRDGEAVADPEVGLLRVDGPGGNPLALAVGFSAHPTVLSPENLEFSGDYPGLTTGRLEAAAGATSLFFIGANGDQEPRFPGYAEWEEPLPRQFEEADKIAEALSGEALRVMEAVEMSPVHTFEAVERVVELPRVNLRASCFYYLFAPVMRLLFRGIFDDEAVFQAVRIDDLLVVAVPAELSAGFGRSLKEAVGVGSTLLVGLANGSIGYVLEEEDYRSGGYEACMSFYGPTFDRFVLDQVRRTVGALGGPGPARSGEGL